MSKDDRLADGAERIERRQDLPPQRSRALIQELTNSRYTLSGAGIGVGTTERRRAPVGARPIGTDRFKI